jgi:hydroxymethylglutaryl-CoA reductase
VAEGRSGAEVVDAIVSASRFAELDPYRAATHNKGIMNGVDAVVLATGNDWRAMEASAHAYAARSGRYAPLALWRRDQDGWLLGTMTLPAAVGVVGGATKVNPVATLALEILGCTSGVELGQIMAAAGLASNLAALRALATDGIQRGHMSLHARSIALAAGASGREVEALAAALVQSREIKVERAITLLRELRSRAS